MGATMTDTKTSMANDSWHLDKKVPLALIVVLAGQIGTFGYWAAMTSAESATQRERLARLEISMDHWQNAQNTIAEKLAGIAAQQAAQTETLNRIYNVLDRKADKQ